MCFNEVQAAQPDRTPASGVSPEAEVTLSKVPSGAHISETLTPVGESQLRYSGTEPQIVLRNGDLITAEQEKNCAGTSISNAKIIGNISIGAQYLDRESSNFKLQTDAVVEGNIVIRAVRDGAVGGLLDVRLEAKTRGIEIIDTDPDGGGEAEKIISVSATQIDPLKIVLGAGMNDLDSLDVDVVKGFALSDGGAVDCNARYGGQGAFIEIDDRIIDGVRTITLNREGQI